jgi:hypothetical protein
LLDGTIPSWLNNAYSSAEWGSADGIDILHTDPAFAPCTTSAGCKVIVGVYGFVASSFAVSITSSSSATLLQLGVGQSGTVALSEAKYYRMLLSQEGNAHPYTLRLAVTPTAGRVQLFVSCTHMMPNVSTAQWSLIPAVGTGSQLDVLSVSAVDKGCSQVGARYYASVVGISAASFTIRASMVDNSTVPVLIPGQATYGTVQSQHLDYYFVRPGGGAGLYDDLNIIAAALAGDVDAYVSASWDSRPRLNPYTGKVESFAVSSEKFGSEDFTISHGWIQDTCYKRTSCYFVLGIFGARLQASNSYSVLVSTPDSTLTLTSGVPLHRHVKTGRLEYFKFTLKQPNVDVIISVTPVSGDPGIDFFVAKNSFMLYPFIFVHLFI